MSKRNLLERSIHNEIGQIERSLLWTLMHDAESSHIAVFSLCDWYKDNP